jgi:hypothetical protein
MTRLWLAAAAGFTAGTTPITGTLRKVRTASNAVVLAVLQAITTISGAMVSTKAPITAETRATSSLSDLVP